MAAKSSLEAALEPVARAMVDGHAVALTGAGVSTESGIPDFRSPGGLWDRFDPFEFAHIDSFRRDPERVWEMLVELRGMVEGAKPNPGHVALAELEWAGLLDGIITQNIDGLHTRAGSKRVVEFHGNGAQLRCLRCDRLYDRGEVPAEPIPPRCQSCQTILKPDAVFFGEAIPARAISGSQELMRSARVLLVCGTSAEVYPAARIPMVAKTHGVVVCEFNLEASLASAFVDHRVAGPVGRTLPALVAAVRALRH